MSFGQFSLRFRQMWGAYQLAFLTPGIWPLYANSRKQILQIPYFLRYACGRPQILQRLYSLTANFCFRCCLIFIAVLAMNFSSYFSPAATVQHLDDKNFCKTVQKFLCAVRCLLIQPFSSAYFVNGMLNNVSNSLASSSVLAVVTKITSIPLTLSTLSYSISGKISCSLIPSA